MIIIILILVFLLSSTIYHQVKKRGEFRENPPPGERIKIGEDHLHIYGEGEGTPTLLFSSGAFSFCYGFYYKIFKELSSKYRALIYDRPGYGWSESTNRARTMDEINKDLKELLDKSNEEGPYILIGHSLGATELLQFANRYPRQTAGVVLLDPAYVEEKNKVVIYLAFAVITFLRITGILRILVNFNIFDIYGAREIRDKYPDRIVKLTELMFYNRGFSLNSIEEYLDLHQTFKDNEEIGEIPLLILSAEHEELRKKNKEFYQELTKHHQELLSLSTKSEHRMIEDADHSFPLSKPELVSKEILSFLKKIKNTGAEIQC